MNWWQDDEQAIRVLVVTYLAILVASAAIREGRELMRGAIGWVLLGAILGTLGTVAWHVACEPCQARAKAWRRQLGSRLIE